MPEPLEAVRRPSLVLLVNDQQWAASALEHVLAQSGYATMRALTGRQALALCASANPDAVIMDTRLSDISGLDVCRLLRQQRESGGMTPVILTTTDSVSRAESLAALEAGAWELCGQPLDGDTLLLKLGNFVRAKQIADHVRGEGLLDQQTGLYNIRGLARRAHEMGADAQRLHAAIACIAFSVEDREPAGTTLNRSIGSADAADEAVTRVGDVCRRFGRASDAYGRLGPREFAVVTSATNGDGARRLVERIQDVLDSLSAVDSDASPVRLHAEFCVVDDYADSQVDAVEMLMRAAAALRDHRHAGQTERREAGHAPGVTGLSLTTPLA